MTENSGAGSGQLASPSVEGQGLTYGQFAASHLWAAAYFAREAFQLETHALTTPRPADFHAEVRHNVVAAIFAAVASVEAYPCEMALRHLASSPHQGALDHAFSQSNVPKKYTAVATAAGIAPPTFGSEPDRAMEDLIFLRNKLVHFTAELPAARNVHNHVEARLRNRFAGSRILQSVHFFPDAFDSYDCAKWSVTTAKEFMERFAAGPGWDCPSTKPAHQSKLALP